MTRALRFPRLLAACVVVGCGWSAQARAAPQANTALVPGLCIRERVGVDSSRNAAVFCGSLRQDLLFLRSSSTSAGLGPYVSLGSVAFDDLRISLGASWLWPVLDDFPIVLSAGALSTNFARLGVDASAFFGVRSYNFHGTYNLAGGLLLQLQQELTPEARRVVGIGIQVDAMLLAVPVLLLWGATQ